MMHAIFAISTRDAFVDTELGSVCVRLCVYSRKRHSRDFNELEALQFPCDMAVVLDSTASVALLHHGSSSSTVAHIAPSSPALPRPYTRLAVPRCSGLRRIAKPPSSASISHRQASRGIVCEQRQETLTPAGAVTDKTWKELVLECDVPVLVDFWAPWCGPCRMIAPLVDELAVQYAGRVRCLKLNTDESPTTATEYGIRSIPTVMIFKQGLKKDTIIGAVPKAALITAIEKFLV